ncbi:tRNA (5-methylaminomethyl-2-thiouridine)(34)-methyltransferase MnmD [Palleronia sp. LCG004]|uniref:tRNA (5-methylaminomethyl-2-thiouridine)(34)-methyltransferase MnmD n=1 Tax=Palleronia sp. LCG004 TaxID=3079304 RepID=UPI0029421CF5|nr:tRNA (5-methylaminomethyl-2-thiouridine)(34)-methyltransferase MnmD [Palleronia sp. LCG004]WOI55461.1 tRNA (5-methylaminomethyl-2-thiouridine)(34)-methyltransferase MnmD [Palleronia sp. LCG004]
MSERIDWREEVPVSSRYDDPYYSLNGGLDETRHVFLDGNDLPARFRPGFHIAELGFGTGLNALAAWALWRESGQDGTLAFTSFEAHPLGADEMARALAAFPTLAPLAADLCEAWATGTREIALPGLSLHVIEGPAEKTLPPWRGRADAWFLDGFSPAKNPALWSDTILSQVGGHTAPGGTAATYSAAGHVRRALADAGFEVARIPGFERKRHMTRAWMPQGL